MSLTCIFNQNFLLFFTQTDYTKEQANCDL